MIKIKVDDYTILPLEEEFINEYKEQEYSIFQDTVISLPNRDIKIPKNTRTIYTNCEDIVYYYLLNERTISPIFASIIYYQVMKKLNIPFKTRFWKFIKSLVNLF